MNFGTLTEETIDEWIRMCRNLGFNQIDSMEAEIFSGLANLSLTGRNGRMDGNLSGG